MSALPCEAVSTRCVDCGAPTGRPEARFCDAHRWRHRGKPAKYVLTPEREEQLRRRYAVVGSHGLGRAWGWPAWRVQRFAAALALTRVKDRRAFTHAEDAFLREHAGERALSWLSRELHRSPASVACHVKRIGLRYGVSPDGFTSRELEAGLGIDHRTLRRYVEDGKLVARYRHGGARPAFDTDPWTVSEREVVRFLREHRDLYRLASVEQEWFLGLVLPVRARA